MSSIEELGQLMKKKYPDRFQGRTDLEAGLELKRRYPSKFLEYRDPAKPVVQRLPDDTLEKEMAVQVVPNISLETKREASLSYREIIDSIAKTDSSLAISIEAEKNLQRNIESLVEYYKPDRGRFTSWWNKGKAEAREKLLDALNREQRQLIDQTVMLQRVLGAIHYLY